MDGWLVGRMDGWLDSLLDGFLTSEFIDEFLDFQNKSEEKTKKRKK